jgi:hypothetical protein
LWYYISFPIFRFLFSALLPSLPSGLPSSATRLYKTGHYFRGGKPESMLYKGFLLAFGLIAAHAALAKPCKSKHSSKHLAVFVLINCVTIADQMMSS